jgi:hypothetical protein
METQVRAELAALKGDKAKLSQQYSNRMAEVLKSYGGNISDLPIDPSNEYYQIQSKLNILSKI